MKERNMKPVRVRIGEIYVLNHVKKDFYTLDVEKWEENIWGEYKFIAVKTNAYHFLFDSDGTCFETNFPVDKKYISLEWVEST
ncbi:MAG: hypothetical protein WC254_07725, partial [Candidatus Woesearchaeota archaeon]